MKKLIILLLLLCLTGCSRYTEVNELGIVEVLAITKNQQITESASYIVPLKEKNDYQILKSKGLSLGNTFLALQNKETKKIYFDQSQILLLNKNILKENSKELISFLLTNFKHPNWLTFLCDQCEEILSLEKKKVFYENLVRKEHTKTGESAITTFEDFASLYLDDFLTAYLPYLELQDNKVTLKGIVAFKNNQDFTTLGKEEAKTFFLLKEKITQVEENIKIDKNISLTLSNLHTKIKLKQDTIEIKVTGKYKLNDSTSLKDKELNKALSNKLKLKINNFLKKERLEQVDLLGISNLFYRQEREKEKALEKAKSAPYNIKINLKKEDYL